MLAFKSAEWAAASAIAAAVAALASWISVWLTGRQWRQTMKIQLRLSAHWDANGELEVMVTNAGPGVAVDTAFAIAVAGRWTSGWAPPSRRALGPGESTRLLIARPPRTETASKPRAVVMGVDARGKLRGWDYEHEKVRLRRPRDRLGRYRQPAFAKDVLAKLYPDIDLDEALSLQGREPRTEER